MKFSREAFPETRLHTALDPATTLQRLQSWCLDLKCLQTAPSLSPLAGRFPRPNLARSTVGAFCALHSGALEKCQRAVPTRNATLARGAASVGAVRHRYGHSVHEVHFS